MTGSRTTSRTTTSAGVAAGVAAGVSAGVADDARRRDAVMRRTARYLSAAVDLRNSIYLNEKDYHFAHRQHGEIRYLFDNNIVRFYLNPFNEFKKVAPFRRGDTETFQALSVVTAEFLFSRMLCGQWGRPPMISQWHAMELEKHAEMLSVHARLMMQAGRGNADGDGFDATFEELICELIDNARNLARLRYSIDRVFSPLAGLGETLASLPFEARQFARMINENLLLPLHLDDFATADILSPSNEAIGAVIRWKEFHRTRLGQADTPVDRNDEADAKTLIQLVGLNKAAAESGSSKPIRYVLVTTDQALFNAALDWLSNEGRGRLDFFPLRRIGQYVPFLNTKEMPNKVESDELFWDIQAALDAFLSTVGTHGGDLPRPLPSWLRTTRPSTDSPFYNSMIELSNRMSEQAERDPQYLETLNRLTELWSRLGRDSVFLNANLLGQRIEAFASLSVFLEDATDIRDAVLDIMEETVAEVERAHVRFSVQHHLAAEIEELRAHKGSVPLRRGMVILRARFEEFIESDSLASFLDRLVTEPDRLPIGQMLERVGACSNHRAFFFSACVAFWAAKWESALFFVERALDKFRRTDDQAHLHEEADLRYFMAVARRYAAMDMDISPAVRVEVLSRTIGLLEELRDEAIANDDPFSECRARLELGLVHITLAFALALVADAATDRQAADYVKKSYEDFGGTIRLLDSALIAAPEDAAFFFKIELLMGLTGYAIYTVFIMPEEEAMPLTEWKSLPIHTREMVEQTREALPEIYTLAPDLLDLAFDSRGRYSARRREIIDRMRAFQRPGPDRTRMDREALHFLAQRISA